MKKITGYRKLLGVNENAGLQELKTVYRNLMKNWHPDKFHDNHELKTEAEAKSKHIIEAYHFLVSIAPETRVQTEAAYILTTTTSGIADFEYKGETLQMKFTDGSSYEYFGVPKAIYVKLINAPAPARFARRHIYNSFVYRSAASALEPVA
jgi:DnaJ-class molecular chaperone